MIKRKKGFGKYVLFKAGNQKNQNIKQDSISAL